MTTALSVAFSPDGTLLCGGYESALRLFAVARPGRECTLLPTWDRGTRSGLRGIVSCLAFSPCSSLLCAGATDGAAALFDIVSGAPIALLHGGHAGGIMHARFSPDGNYLYTGARRDDAIVCWDVRATGGVVYALRRPGDTNQRLGFDIEPCGRHLLAGGTDGAVHVFDLATGACAAEFKAVAAGTAAAVGWVEHHPFAPLAATGSGSRTLLAFAEGESEQHGLDGELRVWRFGDSAAAPADGF